MKTTVTPSMMAVQISHASIQIPLVIIDDFQNFKLSNMNWKKTSDNGDWSKINSFSVHLLILMDRQIIDLERF